MVRLQGYQKELCVDASCMGNRESRTEKLAASPLEMGWLGETEERESVYLGLSMSRSVLSRTPAVFEQQAAACNDVLCAMKETRSV